MRPYALTAVFLTLFPLTVACSKASRTPKGEAPSDDAFHSEGDADTIRAQALAGKNVFYGLDRLRRDLGTEAATSHPTALRQVAAADPRGVPDVAPEDLVAFYDRDLAKLALRGLAPTTCAGVFALLDALTAPLKADYGRIVDALAGGSDHPRAYPGLARTQASADEVSGLVYTLAPSPAVTGFGLNGRIAAGLDGDLVRVEETVTADLDRDILAPDGGDPWADPPATGVALGKINVQWRTTFLVDVVRKTVTYDVAVTKSPASGARSSFAAAAWLNAAGDDVGAGAKARYDTSDAAATGDQASAASDITAKVAGEGADARITLTGTLGSDATRLDDAVRRAATGCVVEDAGLAE
jgi:hypothetical protein